MESKWKQKDFKWKQTKPRKVKEKCSICVDQDPVKDKFNKDYQGRFVSKLKNPKVFVNDHHGHIPHNIQDTDAATVEIRNARERNRVRAVNEAFARLRKIIPYTANRNKRVSKVKTLQKAVQYISELQMVLLNGCCMS